MKLRSLFVAAFTPFLLVGCGEDETPSYIADLKPSERVEMNSHDPLKYIKTSFSYDIKRDKESCVIGIDFTISTSGYSELSYFNYSLAYQISYTILNNYGATSEKIATVNVTAGPAGSCDPVTVKDTTYYRSVRDIKVLKASCPYGFVVKK